MTVPNFLVIGAAKSGTTSLYYYLDQHPDIFMSPIKEPHFFAFEGEKLDFRGPGDEERINRTSITDVGEYRSLFDGASGQRALGEASTSYLYVPKAAEGIRRHVPETKLIAVLRHPAEAAYSAFLKVRDGREPLSDFARALDAEEGRIRDGWSPAFHYGSRGYYHEQLSRYAGAMGEGRVRVYLYEDLRDDPDGVLRDAYRFLGVDDAFVPDTSLRHNASGIPKSEALLAFVRRPNPVKSALKPFIPEKTRRRVFVGLRNRILAKPPPLDPGVRRRLIEAYREDILRLQDMIGRDLSAWLR